MKHDLPVPSFTHEDQALADGYRIVAGTDEAGRGPLAGPVVAAAVIVNRDEEAPWLHAVRDSKQMKEAEREACYAEIIRNAAAYTVVEISPLEIDRINILQASLLGMRRAVERLGIQADYVLVDGRHYPPMEVPGKPIVKGDQQSLSIAAASIVAKVTRDRLMNRLHEAFPHYGWKYHKGYPTLYHRRAVQLFGASPHHRMTFNGVKDAVRIQPSPLFKEELRRLLAGRTRQELQSLSESLLVKRSQLHEAEFDYLKQTALYQMKEHQSRRKTKPSTRHAGTRFETVAARYLQAQGYQIIQHNYYAPGGEIDLIAQTKDVLVFVEVKARNGNAFGQPHEAVSKTKMKNMITAAERFLVDWKIADHQDIRYDVVSILTTKHGSPQITHIEDAFRGEDALDG